MPSEIKIISNDCRLLKRRKKRQQRHLNRILFLFTQKSTCLFVCLFAFFLRSLRDRCPIVTVTCKTNVSSLPGIFSIILSIHPSICQPINNKFQQRRIDIGKNKEVIHCTLAKQFFQLIQNFRSCHFFSEKNNVCSKSVPDDCTTPIFSDLLVSSPNFAPPWRILLIFH